MILKRIGVLSLARVVAVIYGVLGLIVGAAIALVSIVGSALGAAVSGLDESWLGVFFGIGAILVMPLLHALFGFLTGIVVGWVYNGVAALVGGLELELE